MSEENFRLATRHNRYRWILTWLLSLPFFVIAVIAPYTSIVMTIGFPAIYTLGGKIFPGCALHGTLEYTRSKIKYGT